MQQDSTDARLERHLRRLIAASGSGARLPATRTLVADFSASPLTVQRVVQRLAQAGLVETRPGAGTFVARPRTLTRSDFSWQTTALGAARNSAQAVGAAMALNAPDAIAMHSGYPAEDLLPVRLVRSALRRAARGPASLDRPPVAGLRDLRTWFANEANRVNETTRVNDVGAGAGARASGISSDDVIIVPGSQSALTSIFRALAQPGDAIVMESPTYWGAIAAARQAGLVIVPIARGASAPAAEALDEAFATSGARLFYAQPSFANPTGALWTPAETRAILDVVRARNAFVIDDDWAHDFGIEADSRPIIGDDTDGHVVYLRSLTKSVSSAFRVGALIARGPALARIQVDRTVTDLYISGTLQAAAVDVVTDPGWRSHLVRLRSQLRQRRDSLAGFVTARLGPDALTSLPLGGLNLWVQFGDRVDARALAARCLAAGLAVAPGADWFPTEPPGSFLRLNFSGPRPDRFEEAASILAGALAEAP
ncbi:PLP-dependent aminotransferase family protein [Subtercola boreus]|uniref:GntR family transcriptional regulator n=1 Tax=Subtercola boreus TaxID=120213 RepID=A0A3E0WCH7_9MICO|nr:PLP-dependent aminotransferase family protein [Subtercola boreus]RFA21063.1 GntR family transcriptional regulator [Subtercola boreus]RFA21447.1 GntR family transcriptional regulator [Subtercola boreus]RFA27418.1 GntR family transcriptional regulator [Subtercola boreus]